MKATDHNSEMYEDGKKRLTEILDKISDLVDIHGCGGSEFDIAIDELGDSAYHCLELLKKERNQ
jgi:hypothetical protein